METIEATYRIVTPMFLGGADQSPDSGIRPPSFKGALRFWWRALNWERMIEKSEENKRNNRKQSPDSKEKKEPEDPMQVLHAEECRLFGSSAEQGGQGQFLLKVRNAHYKLTPKPDCTASHQYLLGQGLYHFNDGFKRSPIASGNFSVQLVFRPENKKNKGQNKEDMNRMGEALLAIGLLGGMGSRSRKGFGSLVIEQLEGVELIAPQNLDQLERVLKKLTNSKTSKHPPYTAFSSFSRIDISNSGTNAWSLLASVGNQLQLERSYGKEMRGSRKVGSNNYAEQNFCGDHDLILDAIKGKHLLEHPDRVVYGLPHNYFYSGLRKGAQIAPTHSGKRGYESKPRSRRASPLFIHIHQIGNEYFAIQSMLPAVFLPSTDKVEINIDGKRKFQITPNVDYTFIERYMDRFNGRVTI